ncbi:unnamed protein product [Strongylus vulgaris]|uniref:Uncharacterized protein n=1 Tax=Strongylus vulgaris TaxID=40348 RepID=A0A3P7L071_STRVU|nr:unnamed protein product [Strongylus vulgaris]
MACYKKNKERQPCPNDIPSELWKECLRFSALEWQASSIRSSKLRACPKSDQGAQRLRYGETKADIADCSTYWPIRPTSHTLKIFERVLYLKHDFERS